MQHRDWALKQLGDELRINPYQLLFRKELLVRALQAFPNGANVAQIKLHFRDTWGLDISVRKLTTRLSRLRSDGIVRCGPGRLWTLQK